MARPSETGVAGIYQDQHGAFWATLEGAEARQWRERYPDRSVPRRKAKTLTEAVKKQQQLIADLKADRDPNVENPLVAAYVESWIASRKLAASTKLRYQQLWRHQLQPFTLGRLRMRQVTRERVQTWVNALEKQPRQGNPDQVLDPYTVRNAFAVVRAAFTTAVHDGVIGKNPCAGVELQQPDDEEIMPLTPEQVAALSRVIDSFELDKKTGESFPHRNAAFYHMAIRCGPRAGELFGLRWRDVDFDHREIRIQGQMQQGARKRGKTGRKAHRTVPFAPDFLPMLKWHRQNQRDEKAVAGEKWNASDLVFCTENGTPLSHSNTRRQFRALQRRAGLTTPCALCEATGKIDDEACDECEGTGTIPLFHVHSLRHTYAALAIAGGVDIYTLSRRMGHTSITTTANKYGHLYKGRDDDAHAIERLLKRA